MRTDGVLLQQYLDSGDDAPLCELLQRHGPMVQGRCRRRLGLDADDAAQAVFLLLIRKAPSLIGRTDLTSWLYQACQFVARHVIRERARRRKTELEAIAMKPISSVSPELEDTLQVLDPPIDALPQRYRDVIVLCHLEQVTQKEAARRLNLPIGTVAARSARALERLREKLTRNGVAISGVLLSTHMQQEAQRAAQAFDRANIASNTYAASRRNVPGVMQPGAATQIAKGVQHMLFWNRCRNAMYATTVLILAVAALGTVAQDMTSSDPKDVKAGTDAHVASHSPNAAPNSATRSTSETRATLQSLAERYKTELDATITASDQAQKIEQKQIVDLEERRAQNQGDPKDLDAKIRNLQDLSTVRYRRDFARRDELSILHSIFADLSILNDALLVHLNGWNAEGEWEPQRLPFDDRLNLKFSCEFHDVSPKEAFDKVARFSGLRIEPASGLRGDATLRVENTAAEKVLRYLAALYDGEIQIDRSGERVIIAKK
jgi:RNA polymerase sigma factor (sigma-70 family)